MNRLSLGIMVVLMGALVGCKKLSMEPVPVSTSNTTPCNALAPWGFPQISAATPSMTGAPVRRRNTKKGLGLGFLCKSDQYALGYDAGIRAPRWAVEWVDPANWKGEPAKVWFDWRADPFVPESSAITLADYSKENRQDRYRALALVSHKNYATDQTKAGRTFYLSNTLTALKKDEVPGAWERLEDQVVQWSSVKGKLLVISGPVYSNGTPLDWFGHKEEVYGSQQKRGVIAVPTHFFKVVVDVNNKSSIAFVVPNNDSKAEDLPRLAKRISDVERATGIDFFPDASEQDKQKLDRVDVSQWPIQ